MRFVLMLLALCIAATALYGCGGDKNDTANAKTGEGATAGATGDQAGGFAVEAGKKRNQQDVENEKKHFSSEPPPVQVLAGDNTGIIVSKPTAFLVKSQKEYNALMKRHFSHGVQKQPVAPTDWKTRQHIGLFLPKSEKGAIVSVTDVYENTDTGTVVVKATLLTPGDKCGIPKTTPRPFNIVETRKMAATKTKVIIEKQPQSPCK